MKKQLFLSILLLSTSNSYTHARARIIDQNVNQRETPRVEEKMPNHGIDADKAIKLGAISPLGYAAATGNLELTKELIKAGEDVNAVAGDLERTPLHLATLYNNPAIINELINAEANVNIQDKMGYTPLHLAAANNLLDIAEILINAGADVHAQLQLNGKGKPFDLANTPEVRALLEKIMDQKSPLETAIASGNINAIKQLLPQTASIYSEYPSSPIAVTIALWENQDKFSRKEYAEIIKLLKNAEKAH